MKIPATISRTSFTNAKITLPDNTTKFEKNYSNNVDGQGLPLFRAITNLINADNPNRNAKDHTGESGHGLNF